MCRNRCLGRSRCLIVTIFSLKEEMVSFVEMVLVAGFEENGESLECLLFGYK